MQHVTTKILDICDCCQDLKQIEYIPAEDVWHCPDCRTEYVDK